MIAARSGSLICVLLVAVLASAAPGKRVVVVPVLAPGRDPAEVRIAGLVEPALVDGLSKLTELELVNLDGRKPKPPTRVDAKADPRPQGRGIALAKEHNAVYAVVAEPQLLGEGAVVYLQIIEANGKVVGSTTVALSAELLQGGTAALERPLRGGIVQVLDPARFIGRVEMHIDVKATEIEVDGRRQMVVPGTTPVVTLPVGTHAVRVTHSAYRDFLRFVEISFDTTSIENVAMSAFPLTEGEMAEKRRHQTAAPKVPWYRSWWALTITGTVLLGATVGIVYGARPNIGADERATYNAKPGH